MFRPELSESTPDVIMLIIIILCTIMVLILFLIMHVIGKEEDPRARNRVLENILLYIEGFEEYWSEKEAKDHKRAQYAIRCLNKLRNDSDRCSGYLRDLMDELANLAQEMHRQRKPESARIFESCLTALIASV